MIVRKHVVRMSNAAPSRKDFQYRQIIRALIKLYTISRSRIARRKLPRTVPGTEVACVGKSAGSKGSTQDEVVRVQDPLEMNEAREQSATVGLDG